MDKDVQDKYYRIVGGIQALESAAKTATCMPYDHATHSLLEAIRGLTVQAARSAWDYANKMTAEGKEGGQ